MTELRKRTILIGPTGGGIGATTLATALAYEAVRFGFKVLLVDCSSSASFTSVTRRYADPRSEVSLSKAILDGCPAPVYPVDSWDLDPGEPWSEGGPLIPGGKLFISPNFRVDDDPSIAEVLTEPGSIMESRLARALNSADTENIDLVLLDMAGGYLDTQLSATLYAAENILLPVPPRIGWNLGMEALNHKISEWQTATDRKINFLGAVPTMLDLQDDEEFLSNLGPEISAIFGAQIDVFAPGVEYNKAFSAAQAYGRPVTDLASEIQGQHNLELVPAALAKTTLSMLAEMNRNRELTYGDQLFELDAVRRSLRSQEVSGRWKEILTGPAFLDLPTHA